MKIHDPISYITEGLNPKSSGRIIRENVYGRIGDTFVEDYSVNSFGFAIGKTEEEIE